MIRRWDAGLLEALQQHLDSPHASRMMRRRKVISERTFADAKEKHGFAKCQFRGRGKVQVQALLTATAMNVKKLMRQQPVPQSGWAAPGSLNPSALLAHRIICVGPVARLTHRRNPGHRRIR